jgi:nucleoid-associated protein YgaU
MRSLILVLILACAFGVAALWQQSRTQRLREERALAARVASGEAAMTPSGLLGPGEAVVVIGRPSGAPAAPRANAPKGGPPAPRSTVPASPTPAPPPAAPPAPLGDFVLEVGAGQSLSKIAHAHYGHAPVELVTKLAQYNGMADPNALRAGMQLKLPTLERLGVVLKP